MQTLKTEIHVALLNIALKVVKITNQMVQSVTNTWHEYMANLHYKGIEADLTRLLNFLNAFQGDYKNGLEDNMYTITATIVGLLDFTSVSVCLYLPCMPSPCTGSCNVSCSSLSALLPLYSGDVLQW